MALSTVHKNIFANYIGALATTLAAFFFIPVYISYIGVSGYGIIGFYLTLQALFIFLDLGIGVAVNREMAKHFNDKTQLPYLRNLSYSLQIVYWLIGIGLGLCLFIASPYFATSWFKNNDLSAEVVKTVFYIFAITITIRWPYGLYAAGLRGMQHQVVLNGYEIFWNLTKSIGSWLVLKYISPTLIAFLWYQAIITCLQTSGIIIIFWRYLQLKKSKLKFDASILKNLSKYAAGMGVGIILINIVSQLDKVIVSKVADSAKMFGYYTIANNIAILVYSISLPMYMAIFPHFTKQVQEKNDNKLTAEFHYYAKLLSTILLPFGVIIIFNSADLLYLWQKNTEIVNHSSPILQWLIVSTVCSALMMPVHTLIHAKVRIRFMIYSQLIEIAIMIPTLYLLVSKYGVIGGAIGMCILYIGYLLIQAPLIFKTVELKQLTFDWLVKDIFIFLPPLIAIAFIFKTYVQPYFNSNFFNLILYIVLLFTVSYITSFLLNKQIRIQFINKIKPLLKLK